jgi:hypothetical protein
VQTLALAEMKQVPDKIFLIEYSDEVSRKYKSGKKKCVKNYFWRNFF